MESTPRLGLHVGAAQLDKQHQPVIGGVGLVAFFLLWYKSKGD